MKICKKFKDIPLANPTYQDMWYASFDAPKPKTIGHKLFIPKEDGTGFINTAFHAAYKYGTTMVDLKRWAGFKLLMEHGGLKGQLYDWPHIHLLPVSNPVEDDE